jgi:hypothetical protein
MKHAIGIAAAVALLSTGGGAAAWAATGGSPRPSTITDVSGDQEHGFSVEHYDGRVAYPPTFSEAKAECEEYRHELSVVRCKTRARVWYRDLGRMQRALEYAHSQ